MEEFLLRNHSLSSDYCILTGRPELALLHKWVKLYYLQNGTEAIDNGA